MTLYSLKRKSKYLVIIALIIAYGLGTYALGKNNSAFPDITKILGARTDTQNNLNTPIMSPIPANDTQSTSIISSSVKICANTVYSFEIPYPKNWYTTYNTDEQKCTFFAPFSFVVPQETDQPFVPIKIEISSSDKWDGTVKFYENPNDFYNVVAVTNKESDGHPVHKVVAQTTGAASIPKGYLRASFLVFDNKTPLVISYQQMDAKEDVTGNQKAVEDMVSGLKYY